MSKFKTILNHYKDSICGGFVFCNVMKGGLKLVLWQNYPTISIELSINDLLSPNSGFMQAVKRDVYVDKDVKIGDEYIQGTDRQYHSMMLSILSDEEKIEYLELSIIINEQ